MSPECANGHHVTKRWARVAWQDGVPKLCPQCEELRQAGGISQMARNDAKSDYAMSYGCDWARYDNE
jgi:hypothetical protein